VENQIIINQKGLCLESAVPLCFMLNFHFSWLFLLETHAILGRYTNPRLPLPCLYLKNCAGKQKIVFYKHRQKLFINWANIKLWIDL